jgi:predicted nucleotidyltransferase
MSGRRLALARKIARDLREREGSNLVAVGVFGSTARGEDRAHSDLDLLVITRRRRKGIRHRVHDGVLVTVLQLTPAQAREEVTEGPWLNGPLSGWRDARAVYDPVGLIRRVRALASHPTAARFQESARRDLIETFEDYGKIRNAIAAEDVEEAREMALWFSGAAAGTLLDVERRVPRVHRRYFMEARRIGLVGKAIWRLRYDARTLAEMGRLSEDIWAGLLARARKRGVRVPELGEPPRARLTRSARGGPSRGRRGPSRSPGAA